MCADGADPLEAQIEQWRRCLRRRQAIRAPDVERLEVHLRGRGAFAGLERWQTAYLSVYSIWAAIVVVVFPPVFGFKFKGSLPNGIGSFQDSGEITCSTRLPSPSGPRCCSTP